MAFLFNDQLYNRRIKAIKFNKFFRSSKKISAFFLFLGGKAQHATFPFVETDLRF